MSKKFISLILFVFLSISSQILAQEAAISAIPTAPLGNAPNRDPTLPLDQWNEANQQIRDNFVPFNTYPVYENENIGINIGPAQIQIIFPFF